MKNAGFSQLARSATLWASKTGFSAVNEPNIFYPTSFSMEWEIPINWYRHQFQISGSGSSTFQLILNRVRQNTVSNPNWAAVGF